MSIHVSDTSDQWPPQHTPTKNVTNCEILDHLNDKLEIDFFLANPALAIICGSAVYLR